MTIWCLIPNLVLYFLSSLFYLVEPLGEWFQVKEERKNTFSEMAFVLALFGFLLHAIYLIFLMLQKQSIVYVLQPFALVLIFLILCWRLRWQILGAFFMPLALLSMLVFFSQTSLSSLSWLGLTHMILAPLTCALMAGNLVLALVSWIEKKNLRSKKWSRFFVKLPPLLPSEKTARILMQLGFLFLTFLLISGIVLTADRRQESFRMGHIFLALLSWALYGFLLYRKQKALNEAWPLFALLGFLSLALTFYL